MTAGGSAASLPAAFGEPWDVPSVAAGRPAPPALTHPATRYLPAAFAVCPAAPRFEDHDDCPAGCAYRQALDAYRAARYSHPPAAATGLRGRRLRWALARWRRTVDTERTP